MSRQATMRTLPNCDVCAVSGELVPAAYDAKTAHGPWAFVCEPHFQRLGIGLGTGQGQRLVVPIEEDR